MLLEGYTSARMSELPIYIMHGVLDWMFPIELPCRRHGLACGWCPSHLSGNR
ncbi:MAG: hypothetical protein Ct9H300mP8_13300 [Gammaproteobacteria bacterium]|nr:MAG: hypothetical protein Ct9H300mP8_13300 [Gammaproteobacteria bacterium]